MNIQASIQKKNKNKNKTKQNKIKMAKENCSEWANHPYANGSLVGTPTLHRAKVGLLGRRCQHQTR